MIFQAIRGTQDLLPSALRTWRSLEQKAFKIADLYGFQEIRTPLFEKADLFIKGLGVMAGIVERELWTFHDKHGLKLALRPDMTASVVRAYQQNNLAREFIGLGKLCYVAPVFLLGKEGDEPSRQAHHFGLEVFGSANAAVDAELLSLAADFCQTLGLDDIHLEINTLGCSRCRTAHHDALREFFSSRQSELCGTCKRKHRAHPTWTLSCPETSCTALANLAPTMLGYLCQDCKFHFNQLKFFLKEMQLDVQFNPRVVRDLEYYTRTVFRVVAGDRTIACGGRYDGLFQHLGGTETPAVGIAFYLDEIAALMPQEPSGLDDVEVVFLPEGDEAIRALLPVCQQLRRHGVRAEVLYEGQEQVPPCHFQVRLLEREAYRGTVDVKDQNRGSIEKVSPEKLTTRLLSLLGLSDDPAGNNNSRGLRRRLQRSRRENNHQPHAPAGRNAEVSRHDNRDDRDRDRERDRDRGERDQDPAEAEVVETSIEQSVETVEEGGRRRKRRRRRRGEGVPVEASSETLAAVDGDDEGIEEEAPVPRAQAETSRNPERSARPQRDEQRDRGPRNWPDRGRNGGERKAEPREDSRRGPATEAPPPRRTPEEPRREEPAKAFIPALILGGVPAPKAASALGSENTARDSQPRAALPIPATPQTPAAGAPVLNWSVSLKPRDGTKQDDAEDESFMDQPETVHSGPRRPARRRR